MSDITGIVFAHGNRLYAWRMPMTEPVLLLERESAITTISCSLGAGAHSGSIWYGTVDGEVFRNLECDPNHVYDGVVASIACLGTFDLLNKQVPYNLLSEENNLLICVQKDAKALFLCHKTGAKLSTVNPKRGLVHMTVRRSCLYWTNEGTVYRHFDESHKERSYNTNHCFIVPFGWHNFMVCHYHNEETHPEGIVISTRDHRTIATIDPSTYGSVLLMGSYEQEEKRHLFFATRFHKMAEVPKDHIVYSSMPFIAPAGFVPAPTTLFTLVKNRQVGNWDGTNAVCTVDESFVDRLIKKATHKS